MQYKTHRSRSVVLLIMATAGTSMAQSHRALDDSIADVVRAFPAHEPSLFIQEELIAGLPYDGFSFHANKGQVFEPVFEAYDIFVIEDIEPVTNAMLTTFRSAVTWTSDPRGAEDFVVRVFENNGTGLPGENDYTGELVMRSLPGAGFIDLATGEGVTDFGGQCLSAGSYYLVWHTRMDFSCCGQTFFFQQEGEPTVGGGGANNAWQWVPLDGYGNGVHFPVRDPDENEPRGVNYLLFGEPANCDFPCSNPDCPADLDGDGDTDADDFFAYLDLFASNDPCADIDQNGSIDSDDFFAYLDLFVQGC